MVALIAQSSSSNPIGTFVLFAALGVLFYLFLLRPQQRRAKAQQALVNSVEVGDEIITTSGIYGTVTAIDDEEGTVTLQIGPGTEIRMLRAGVGRLAVDDSSSYDEYEGEEEDDTYDAEVDADEDHSLPDAPQEYPDQPGQIKEL